MTLKKEDTTIHWFVLYTYPRAEKQVKERLENSGFDVWLPLHRSPRVWSDRVKYVDIPLFNSYVFVHTTRNRLASLMRVYGVARIVMYNGEPAVVRPAEIEAIKVFLEQANDHTLLPGDEVEILCGAMKHVSGKIRRIKKHHLVLYLEQLGAMICVRLDEVARLPQGRAAGK